MTRREQMFWALATRAAILMALVAAYEWAIRPVVIWIGRWLG